MGKQIIHTDKAPAAIGPYSQGVKIANLLFTSGQIPINPSNGELIKDDIASATKQVMENIVAILEEAGTTLEKVVKTTIFLKDMNDFQIVNEVYGKYFTSQQPARSCVEVAALPKGALVEIEVIAAIE